MKLPEHKIERDRKADKVWHLFAGSEKIASFTTFCMGPNGGVFCIKTDKGWTREMADSAFREHLKKGETSCSFL